MSRNIYQNLDTAFVNLPALVRYLCKRGFLGQIHVEMSAYEADIVFKGNNEIEVSEKDHMTGRVAEGEEAMQRLVIRVAEPGGIINVLQKDSFEMAEEPTVELKPEAQIPVVHVRTTGELEMPFMEIEVEGALATVEQLSPQPMFSQLIAERPIEPSDIDSNVLGEDDWKSLLKLTVEVLASIDRSLNACGLDFQAAFGKASSELADDFTFLRDVKYNGGQLTVNARPAASIFINGIMEAVRRVMNRLGANPRFTELHHRACEKLIDLVHRHKEDFDRYAVTAPVYRVLGVNVNQLP